MKFTGRLLMLPVAFESATLDFLIPGYEQPDFMGIVGVFVFVDQVLPRLRMEDVIRFQTRLVSGQERQ